MAKDRAALPEGRVVYTDTLKEKGPSKALISLRYELKGRPDYIVETREGIVPVEIKSAGFPRSGRPFDSHVLQLASYCLLCEETMKARVPFGIIRYRTGEARVAFTPELRERLLALLKEIRAARDTKALHRNHTKARRCKACGFRHACAEALP